MTGPKALLATLAMAAGLVAMAFGLRGPYQRAAIEYWQSRLSAASDEELPGRIREVSDLDEIGIGALIESLDVPRENLAQAAKRALLEKLGLWQSLDDAKSATNFAQLVSRLEKRSATFGPQGRGAARELALKMLAWRPTHDPGDRGAIVSACETILALSPPAKPPAPVEPTFAALPHKAAPEPLQVSDPQLDRATAELARLPGGGLAIESFPAAPRLLSEDADASVAPHLLPNGNPLRPHSADRLEKPGVFANTSPPSLSAGDAQPIRAMSLTESISQSEEDLSSLKPLSTSALHAMNEIEVMRLLQDPSPKTVAAAREELQRRNFGAVQIDLATRLFAADSQVRRELARALPTLRSIDPTPWLLWLARDEDAEVRLTAISLMATVSDPRLLAEIERMASGDADPRIRRCAEQLRQLR